MDDVTAFETEAVREAFDPIDELVDTLSLYQAVKALPERQQNVVVFPYFLDCSTAETAAFLGITEAGVRSTARYAKRRLRRALDLRGEEGEQDGRP